MSPFIPTGYLTLASAIDRVAELMQGGDAGRLFTEDERATLRNWQGWLDQLKRRQPEPVTPVPKAGGRGLFVARTPSEKYPHRLVEAEPRRPDVTPEDIPGLLEKEAAFKEQQRAAKNVLRQLLHVGRVPSEIFPGNGPPIEIPRYIWAGGQWDEALSLHRVTFRPDILSVTGFPLISRDALEAAFNADGTVREEPEPEPVAPETDGEETTENLAPNHPDSQHEPQEPVETPVPAQATLAAPPDKNRKRDVEADALLKNQVETVLTLARTEWPEGKKFPGVKPAARELIRKHHSKINYKFSTVCKILDGTYPASRRLDIPGM